MVLVYCLVCSCCLKDPCSRDYRRQMGSNTQQFLWLRPLVWCSSSYSLHTWWTATLVGPCVSSRHHYHGTMHRAISIVYPWIGSIQNFLPWHYADPSHCPFSLLISSSALVCLWLYWLNPGWHIVFYVSMEHLAAVVTASVDGKSVDYMMVCTQQWQCRWLTDP